jgi:hypothetical protein
VYISTTVLLSAVVVVVVVVAAAAAAVVVVIVVVVVVIVNVAVFVAALPVCVCDRRVRASCSPRTPEALARTFPQRS